MNSKISLFILIVVLWAYPNSLAQPQSADRQAASERAHFIHAGAFADIARAQELVASLRSTSHQVLVEESRVNGGDYFRVLVGPFPDETSAQQVKNGLEASGFTSGFITIRGRGEVQSMVSQATAPKGRAIAAAPSLCANLPNRSLPPEAQMRVLNAQAGKAVDEKDYAKVLDLFELMDCIRHPRVLKLFLIEAHLSKDTGDYLRAIEAVENYLQRADSGDPDYNTAIAMFVELEELVPADARREKRSRAMDGAVKPQRGENGRASETFPLTLSRVRANRDDPVPAERGKASIYAPGFNGMPTASGEVFDESAMTAAHPSLPLPSLVQVVNEDNGREVVVRVNDRGPFDGKRVLEMSPRAGDVLGVSRGETVNVRIRYLGPAPLKSR